MIDGIAQPFVWGVFRGSIYLPANFSAGGTDGDRQGILMHELAHVARFDALVNFLQVIAQGLFFFHPLVWWANSRIRQEREKCCDEVAIARLGGSPRQYGSAIVETLVREYEESRPLPSMAVAGSVKNIEDRVKTIMVPNKKFYSRPSRIAVISVLMLAALAVPTALVLTTRGNETARTEIRISVNDKALDEMLQVYVEKLQADKMMETRSIAKKIAERKDPRTIPLLIGVIDADNTYDTVYWIGYFGLSKLTGVEYSTFHDGAWWRRWWEKNKSRYSKEVRSIPIPELPKTRLGKGYKPFSEDLDSLDGKLRWMIEKIKADDAQGMSLSGVAGDIAKYKDPKSIPILIGAIDADNSYGTIYGIGYFGLSKLTGVEYSTFHDGAWWRGWWEKNKSNYPKEVQDIPIPNLPKTRQGKGHKPFSQDLDSLDGKLRWTIEKIKADAAQEIYQSDIAGDIARYKDPRAIPILIGVIDADNSYPTIYGLGYFGLSKLTGVSYSEFHDGAWWRRWWEKNKAKYPADVQNISIPDLPKTEAGKKHQSFPEELDSLDGKLRQIVKMAKSGKKSNYFGIASEIAAFNDPRAIPVLIGVIEADDTYDTIYGVGYFGLSKLAGVQYDGTHDGKWWRQWWAKNKSSFSAEIQKIQIPILPKRKPSPVTSEKPASGADDVADIPAQDLKAGDDANKCYFLIGPKEKALVPAEGYKLLVVLPGGDGSANFHPFVKRILKFGLSNDYVVAQPVSKEWSPGQFNQMVWPTKNSQFSGMKFSTEEFIEAVIRDVKSKYKLNPRYLFTLGWSSGGPPCYAASLTRNTPITGSFIAMSVFKPDQLPSLENAKGHPYFLLQSPQDFIPLSMVREGAKDLEKNGAKVNLLTYEGGHGWRGDVYGNIQTGIQWLEKQASSVGKANSNIEHQTQEKSVGQGPPYETAKGVKGSETAVGDSRNLLRKINEAFAVSQEEFRNIELVTSMRQYDWDNQTRDWKQSYARTFVRAWFESAPPGKVRMEFDPEIGKWEGGPRPYCETRYLLAYDGEAFRKIDFVYNEENRMYHARLSQSSRGREKYLDYAAFATGLNLLPFSENPQSLFQRFFESQQLLVKVLGRGYINAKTVEELGGKFVFVEVGSSPGKIFASYWLDPARNYALVQYRSGPKGKPAFLVVRVHAWKKVGEHLWVPTAAVSQWQGRNGMAAYNVQWIGHFDPANSRTIFSAQDIRLGEKTPQMPVGPLSIQPVPTWQEPVLPAEYQTKSLPQPATQAVGEKLTLNIEKL